MKMTPLGGASGAILENYGNMLASPELNLCRENFFHKSVSKWNDCIVCKNICEVQDWFCKYGEQLLLSHMP